MSQIKNGKRPLAEKQAATPTPFNMEDVFGNALGLDPEIYKKIQEKGMDCRWINAKKLEELQGWHPHGWRVVRMNEICDNVDTHSFQFGRDPQGYIRRGDCILAIRDKEMGNKHKAYLIQEAEKASRSTSSKAHAEELRSFVRKAGLNIRVDEGYEDKNEPSDE